MSEAPERIWAVTEPDDISADILGDVYAQQVPDGVVGTPVEYVRSDQIEKLEAKLAKAMEERDRAIEWRDHDKARAEAAENHLLTRLKVLRKYFDLTDEELDEMSKDARADNQRQLMLINKSLAAYRNAVGGKG